MMSVCCSPHLPCCSTRFFTDLFNLGGKEKAQSTENGEWERLDWRKPMRSWKSGGRNPNPHHLIICYCRNHECSSYCTWLPKPEEGQTCSICSLATSPQHWSKAGRLDWVTLVSEKLKSWAYVPWQQHASHLGPLCIKIPVIPEALDSSPTHCYIPCSLPMPREKEGRDKSKRQLLHCRAPAGPRAIILTTTDGTDPDGSTALDGTNCKLVYSGSSLLFLELLIVIAWLSITYLQMSGSNKLFVFYSTGLQLDLEVACCMPTSWSTGNNLLRSTDSFLLEKKKSI